MQVEYAQDWLATPPRGHGPEAGGVARPTRPAPGPAGCVGDIGTHAFNLAEFITGDEVDGARGGAPYLRGGAAPRRQRPHAAALPVRRARACSGAARWRRGQENGLRIRVYGEKAGLEWAQENPNLLVFTPLGRAAAPDPPQRRRRRRRLAGRLAHPGRPPGGLSRRLRPALHRRRRADRGAARGPRARPAALQVPTVEHGVRGVRFIEAAVRSSQRRAAWVDVSGETRRAHPPHKGDRQKIRHV